MELWKIAKALKLHNKDGKKVRCLHPLGFIFLLIAILVVIVKLIKGVLLELKEEFEGITEMLCWW